MENVTTLKGLTSMYDDNEGIISVTLWHRSTEFGIGTWLGMFHINQIPPCYEDRQVIGFHVLPDELDVHDITLCVVIN